MQLLCRTVPRNKIVDKLLPEELIKLLFMTHAADNARFPNALRMKWTLQNCRIAWSRREWQTRKWRIFHSMAHFTGCKYRYVVYVWII